jgi:guanylate kinase
MEFRQTIVQPPLLVISGPSGSGKQTAINHLRSPPHSFEHIVTYTTRKPRKGETEGVEYRFVSAEEFSALVRSGQIFEYTRTYGDSLYGSPIDLAEPKGHLPQLCELDPVGLIRLKRFAQRPIVSLFVLPPSLAVLADRVRQRSNDHNLDVRMAVAQQQIQMATMYDYVVLNDRMDEFLNDRSIIAQAESIKYRGLQTYSTKFFEGVADNRGA